MTRYTAADREELALACEAAIEAGNLGGSFAQQLRDAATFLHQAAEGQGETRLLQPSEYPPCPCAACVEERATPTEPTPAPPTIVEQQAANQAAYHEWLRSPAGTPSPIWPYPARPASVEPAGAHIPRCATCPHFSTHPCQTPEFVKCLEWRYGVPADGSGYCYLHPDAAKGEASK